MKNLLTILFLFIAFTIKAQYIPNANAYQYKGLKQTNSLQPPTATGLPVTAINAPDSNYAALYYDKTDTSWYQFNPVAKTWSKFGGIAIGVTDSIFITSIDSIFITSTDSIFIVSGNDTIYIGNSSPAVDSIYKSNDSLLYTKGGLVFYVTDIPTGVVVDSALQYLTAGFGLLGVNYNTSEPSTFQVDTSVIATKNDIINNPGPPVIDTSGNTQWAADTILTSDYTGEEGHTYLIWNHITGTDFIGHEQHIMTVIGGLNTYDTASVGDLIVIVNDNNASAYYQLTDTGWRFIQKNWKQGYDYPTSWLDGGTGNNQGIRLFTRGQQRFRINPGGDIFILRHNYDSANRAISYYKPGLNGKLDTGHLNPLILTTTGSSGPSTLNGDTLNIPVYTGGSGNPNDTLYYNVEWFGAVHDSVTDDGPAIQAGIDYIHNNVPGAILFFPAGNYRDTLPVYMRSNVNLLGVGESSNIFNDRVTSTKFNDRGPIFFGNLTPASWDSSDLKYFSASYANSNKVKVGTDIDSFAIGDIVIMRGATFWLNTDGQVRPHVVRINKVVDKSGDTLILDESLDTTITKIAISGHYLPGSGKRLDAYGNPAKFISNFSVSNLKLQSNYGDVTLGVAMYKAKFQNIWTEGNESLGGNGEAFCNFDHIYAKFREQAWESSIGTHNTIINDLQATWILNPAGENKPVIKFGESVYNVLFTNLKINNGNPTRPAVWFGASTYCTINGFGIHGENITDELISFDMSNNVIGNTVTNGIVYSNSAQRYVDFEKTAGVDARLADNQISYVRFFGATSANAIRLDGAGTSLKDCYFEDGSIGFGDSLVSYKIDNTTFKEPGLTYIAKASAGVNFIDVASGLKLTTTTGTAGTDSLLVQTNGIVRRISPTYYSTGGGGTSLDGTGYVKMSGTTPSYIPTIPVTDGGTGLSSTTAYGTLTGGTTSTGAFQNAGTGTSGQFLRSNGASALPTWQTVPVLDVTYPYVWTPTTPFYHTFQVDNLTTTRQNALFLYNATAATGGATVQNSPALYMEGSGWNSTGSVSQTFGIQQYVIPSAAAGNIGGSIVWDSYRNGTRLGTLMTLTSAGALSSTTYTASSSVTTPLINSAGANTILSVQNAGGSGSGGSVNRSLILNSGTSSQTNGEWVAVQVGDIINQSSSTTPNTHFRIAPYEQSLSSGAQYFMEAGTRSGSAQTTTFTQLFGVTNKGKIVMDATVTAGGTTGNQTINKPSGTVNIAAAGTTVTVTNNLVTTSSIVLAVLRTNDATATIKNVVPGSGSFVINLGAAATAEVSIGFVVIN